MNWQLLARANTHPLRISILEVLAIDGGRTLSPSDLSYELRTPLSNVNYHVTELRRTGPGRADRRTPGARRHRALLPRGAPSSATSRSGNSRNGRQERADGRPAPFELQSGRREADDGSRTRDLELGKLALYQLSYVRAGADSTTGGAVAGGGRDLESAP